MASLSQCRALAGSKAFTGVRPRQAKLATNGVKYTMKRKDSYMVEVNVGEDEPEDIAVRRFMKKVVESRLIEQLRARRYKETPIEERKRRLRERIEARKMGIVLPTWEEEYGQDPDVKPFDEFFEDGRENEAGFVENLVHGGYMTADNSVGQWGAYVDNNNRFGGYMSPQQGGFMPQQGGYQQQGGYIN